MYIKTFENYFGTIKGGTASDGDKSFTDDWKKITIEDVKDAFPDIDFEYGGIIKNTYRESESLIIPDLETALAILKFLDKLTPYGFAGNGGRCEDIIPLWNKLIQPNTIVKFAIPMFYNRRYHQFTCFYFDNGFKKSPIVEFDSTKSNTPAIAIYDERLRRIVHFDSSEYDEFYSKYLPL